MPTTLTKARQIVMTVLHDLSIDYKLLGLHNLKSVMITTDSNNAVSNTLIKVHGRWSSHRSEDGYNEEDLKSRSAVSSQYCYLDIFRQ